MRMSKCVLPALLMALPFAVHAENQGKFYVSGTAEYIVNSKADAELEGFGDIGTLDYKNSFGGLAAVGYYVTNNIRAELEGGYRNLEPKDKLQTEDDTNLISTMVNGYYNFETGTAFSPYLGAGLGWVHEQENNGDALGYQAMVGVDYAISEKSTVFAGYRFFGTDNFTYESEGETINAKAQGHGINLGYRFTF